MPSKFLWILDNGHGTETPGKRSPKLSDGRQLLEYKFNRDIVKLLVSKLQKAKINSHVLVPEIKDISLSERVMRANKLNTKFQKILISIHGNALNDDWSDANGIETFHFTGSKKSERLANVFQNQLITTVGWRDRGVKEAGFYIIKHTQMPAILTENGFFSNQQECIKMLDPFWQNKIVDAHLKAIKEIEAVGYNF